MSASFTVDALTLSAQIAASDPAGSAWVSANAGSGKTHVLAQRVKRLLLSGVKPEKILCLTYTKAAAGNMANRILAELSSWVRMDEADLRTVIAALDDRLPGHVSEKVVQRARRLFAEALETPGGLKIQTIHAFCDALLHQFPFEAGLAGGFQLIDELQQKILVDDAFGKVMESGDRNLIAALTQLTLEKGLDDLKRDIVGGLPLFAKYFERDENLRAGIFAALGLPAGCQAAHITDEILAHSCLPEAEWAGAIAALQATGKKDDAGRAAALHRAQTLQGFSRAQAYLSLFLTDKGEPRKEARFISADLKKSQPALAQNLLAELQRIAPLRERMRLFELAQRNLALIEIAHHVWQEIEHVKRLRGLVSFDDVIALAGQLLNSEGAAWVRYKLDQGLDHILLDEAQDTSAAQWHVIEGLVQEFFAGYGATPRRRTLFAVGDDKQSIFSFQGAEPQLFDIKRRHFTSSAASAGQTLKAVALNLSFRSSPVVLEAVESVFADGTAAQGVTSAEVFPAHSAAKRNLPGLVELWPLEEAEEKKQVSAFTHPFETSDETRPQLRLARRIARAIAGEIRAKRCKAGDILILVRTRNPLFDALLRELKQAAIPVAGADRLALTEHIAAMDLMALGDAILLPEDDLNFAALLKSPLIGLDEDDLFELAYQRPASLFENLRRRASEKPHWQKAFEQFETWQDCARECRPYEFFAQVLGADGRRDAILRRLGREAGEVLDEFLNAALGFENSEIPSLQNFLAWLRRADIVIKREMQQGLDEVRVMTVHNAKGLEAKWIVLADTADKPDKGKLPHFYEVQTGRTQSVLWAAGEKNSIGPIKPARDAAQVSQDEEYRRLLYVALTRAEQRLTICGAVSKKIPDLCWHDLAAKALEKPDYAEHDGEGRLWRHVIRFGEMESREDEKSFEQTFMPAAWLKTIPQATIIRRVLTASGPAEEHAFPASGLDPQTAKQRGIALHKLLEMLPSLDDEKRSAAALKYLHQQMPDLLEEEAVALVQEVLQVFRLLEEKNFLGANSLGEVPLAANTETEGGVPAILSSVIDRLIVTDHEIHVIDFKSGVAPSMGVAPAHYRRQLALYRRALQKMAAGRAIRCYLLWTGEPRLEEIYDIDENKTVTTRAKIA